MEDSLRRKCRQMKTNTRVLLKAWSISILSCLICFAAATLSASGSRKKKTKFSFPWTKPRGRMTVLWSVPYAFRRRPPVPSILLRGETSRGRKPIAMPFSLAGSYLIDSTTGAKIPCVDPFAPKTIFRGAVPYSSPCPQWLDSHGGGVFFFHRLHHPGQEAFHSLISSRFTPPWMQSRFPSHLYSRNHRMG